MLTTPYYAVIFISERTATDTDGYAIMAERMKTLASQQPGYLGIDSVRSDIGITISYWKDLESIRQWKLQTEHQLAQQYGREKWYSKYTVRICKVEREYQFSTH